MQEGKVSKGQVVKEGFSRGWKERWSWARPWRKGPIWVSLRKCLNRGVQREAKGKHGWLDEKLEGKRPEELVGTLIALWEWDGRKVESWSQRVWGSAMRASCHCLAFGKNRLLERSLCQLLRPWSSVPTSLSSGSLLIPGIQAPTWSSG